MEAKLKKRITILVLGLFLFGLIACAGGKFYRPGKLGDDGGLRSPLTPPSQDGVADNYWKVEEDIRLYYFAHGESKPVLVIHGGPGIPPAKPWKGLEAIEGYKFFYYHQRGCGKSTHPVDRFESKNYYRNMVSLNSLLGMPAQLADIERIRRIWEQDRLILIGHSYGGFLATLYALEFPEHVGKMVLISPAGVLKLPADYGGMDMVKEYLSDEGKKDYDYFIKHYFDYGKIFTKSEAELTVLNREYGEFYTTALKAKGLELSEEILSTDGIGGWLVHALYFSTGKKYDYKNYLKKIKTDALVIHGDKDVYPEEVSREYAELIPKGKLKIIEKASHFSFYEQPEEFAAIVNDFLRN